MQEIIYEQTGLIITIILKDFFILFPINLSLFLLFKEKGIITSIGSLKLLFILIQILCFSYQPIKDLILPYFLKINLNILIILTILIIIIKLVLKKKIIYYSFLANLIAFSLFLFLQEKIIFNIFYLFLALIFIIGLIANFYQMAYIDKLTKLPSRRALNEDLMKLGNSYSLAILDIDHFKKFNDNYGHNIGDEVLKMIAAIMKKTKGGAKVYRYGGEEFILLFPGKDSTETKVHLEQLRKNIKNRGFTIRKKKRNKKNRGKNKLKKSNNTVVKITVSIGLAENKRKYKNVKEVIIAADKALYKAKNAGRNCVKIAP